ncbi:MAG: PEP-CTERM sorting domain-containing protein [Gemmatimonadaceae bacterium]
MNSINFRNAIRVLRCATALSAIALTATLSSQTYTLTFDAGDPVGGLAAGSILSNQYAALGAQFSSPFFSGAGGPNGDWGASIDRTVVSLAGADVGALGLPGFVSGNGVRALSGWLDEDGDPSIRLNFGFNVDFVSVDFAGIGIGDEGLFTGFRAYSGSTLLGSVFATRQSVVSQQRLQYFASAGQLVTHIALLPGTYTDWVAFDNVSYRRASTTVPEPGTGLLLVGGLCSMFVARHRRNRHNRAQ